MQEYSNVSEDGLVIIRLLNLATYVYQVNGQTFTQTMDKPAQQRILRRLYRDIMNDRAGNEPQEPALPQKE